MAWNFWTGRPPPQPPRHGALFSIAAAAGVGSGLPAGSQVFGPPAGQAEAQGAQPAVGIGQSFGPPAGLVTAATGPVNTTIGTPNNFAPGIGQITAFGYPAVLGSTEAIVPAPPAATFAPCLTELGLDIWERVGIQGNQLTVTHLTSMRRSMNLVLARWSNRGVSLWRVAQASVPLVQGTATYQLPSNTIEMLDSYISVTESTVTTDRIITPISRGTYAALPNKLTQGPPTIFWFDRLIAPSVTLWPVPDATSSYVLNYFAFTQVADMDPAMGAVPGIPYRFLEAYTAAVAASIAQKWCDPQRAVALDAYSKEVWEEASREDSEKGTSILVPDFSGYMD